MTESRAFLLILAGGAIFEVVSILGMAALGAGNDLLVFGLIIPVVAMSYLISRMVMHYGESGRRERR
jgi:hypothetical protein